MPLSCVELSSYPPDAVKVLVIDDHPALRAGLEGLLGLEQGFEVLGALPNDLHVLARIDARRPHVVILDYALDRGDGLSLCFRIKQLPCPPRVVLYSAYVDRVFAVPAALAQADAIVAKSAPVDQLLTAVRAVLAGTRTITPLDREAVVAASSRLAAEDLPVAGMLFANVGIDEIAITLGQPPQDIRARALRIIGELQTRDRTDRGPRGASGRPVGR
jgi:DNA-binding NarL/FixJ family response regulator